MTDTATQPPAASQPSEEGENEIIATYNALHKDKLGAHWLWVVIEQIAAGVPETQALREFDYYEKRPAGEVAKDAGWRDIESAPEGESVLVHMELLGAAYMARRADTGRWISHGGAIWPANSFTHWMPFPAPPVLPTKE